MTIEPVGELFRVNCEYYVVEEYDNGEEVYWIVSRMGAGEFDDAVLRRHDDFDTRQEAIDWLQKLEG